MSISIVSITLAVIANLCFSIIYEFVVYDGNIILTSVHLLTLLIVLIFILTKWNELQDNLAKLKTSYSGMLASKNKAQAMFDTLFEAVPCAIAAISPNYEIRATNNALSELVKIGKSTLLGQTCYNTFNNGTRCADCPVHKAFLTKEVHHNRKRELVRKDQEMYIDQTALPIIDNKGHVKYVLELITDVTEKELAKRQANELFIETITALTKLIDSRDEVTGKHSLNTKNIAIKLGKLQGLSAQDLNELSLAATLHDIGKIGISDELLKKPGKLTPEEYAQIKQHSQIGFEALKNIPSLKNVANYILHHHENYNGTGYPQGLQGDAIPLLARILTIADVWEAINADRPYRKHMAKEQAVLTMLLDRGKKFDPRLLDLFLYMLCQDDVQIKAILSKAKASIEYQKRKEKLSSL